MAQSIRRGDIFTVDLEPVRGAVLNQIRTVDKMRLGRYWGRVSAQTMAQVDDAIAELD
ncbi:MAG: type II toxin-antitoxin system PemK/MazF family toxin [Caldilineaceae bacterium]|jgi:mRNA-degrading endonuclease toxin of MazEF toxin-antitoxin module